MSTKVQMATLRIIQHKDKPILIGPCLHLQSFFQLLKQSLKLPLNRSFSFFFREDNCNEESEIVHKHYAQIESITDGPEVGETTAKLLSYLLPIACALFIAVLSIWFCMRLKSPFFRHKSKFSLFECILH